MRLTDHEEAYCADWIFELRDEQLKRLYESDYINWKSDRDLFDSQKEFIESHIDAYNNKEKDWESALHIALDELCFKYNCLHQNERAIFIGNFAYIFDKDAVMDSLYDSGVRLDSGVYSFDDFMQLDRLTLSVKDEAVLSKINSSCKAKLTLEMMSKIVSSLPYEDTSEGFSKLIMMLSTREGTLCLSDSHGRKHFVTIDEYERLCSYFGAKEVMYDENGKQYIDGDEELALEEGDELEFTEWTFAIGDYVHSERFNDDQDLWVAFLLYLLNDKGCKFCPQMPKDFTKNMTIEQVVEAVDDAINGMYGFG